LINVPRKHIVHTVRQARSTRSWRVTCCSRTVESFNPLRGTAEIEHRSCIWNILRV